jgi:hypothetical protein
MPHFFLARPEHCGAPCLMFPIDYVNCLLHFVSILSAIKSVRKEDNQENKETFQKIGYNLWKFYNCALYGKTS